MRALKSTSAHSQCATHDSVTKAHPGRVFVPVYSGTNWRFVYIETTAIGEQAFWEEEPGAVRRFRFTPSLAERQSILDAVHASFAQGRSPRYIDLDVPLGSLGAAEQFSLASYRRFVHDRGGLSDAIDLDRRILAFLRESGSTTSGAPSECAHQELAGVNVSCQKAA